MEKGNYTEKEQQEAINEIIRLLNKYQLSIETEHQIKIVPIFAREAKDAE